MSGEWVRILKEAAVNYVQVLSQLFPWKIKENQCLYWKVQL